MQSLLRIVNKKTFLRTHTLLRKNNLANLLLYFDQVPFSYSFLNLSPRRSIHPPLLIVSHSYQFIKYKCKSYSVLYCPLSPHVPLPLPAQALPSTNKTNHSEFPFDSMMLWSSWLLQSLSTLLTLPLLMESLELKTAWR